MAITRTFAAAMLAAAIAATATVGVQQAAAEGPLAAVDYGAWQYGENGWGAYWYDLYPTSFRMWDTDPWTRAEIRDLEPARLRLTCPARYTPYIQLVSAGFTGYYDTDREVEYRFGDDITHERWRAGRVTFF